RSVIQKVRELTGYEHILPGLEVLVPSEKSMPPYKDEFIANTVLRSFKEYKIDFEFNGNTKNPPAPVRNQFRDDATRQISRDDRTTVYNVPTSASPLALIDKSGIIHQY